nr:glycerol-3-phosphate acyltransferase, chloroplastic isoform X1 [Ipomoea batatas]
MAILSVPSSRLFTSTTTVPKISNVSSSPSPATASCSTTKVESIAVKHCRRCRFAVFCSSKARSMAEMLVEKSASSTAAAAASSVSHSGNQELRTFLDARSEEDLLSGVRREADDGRLPQTVAQRMEELYRNYRNAVN